jgi:hypothetical protein
LLECDVEPNDPAIQKAAATLRQISIGETQTYDISLAIMFFDRLGDKRDYPLIESLTVRLVRGQVPGGGWSYGCPLDDAEIARLTAVLRGQKELPKPGEGGGQQQPPQGIRMPAQPNNAPSGFPAPMRPNFGMSVEGGGDNSNTQFATLALWVTRRHKLKANAALAAVEDRFRVMQWPDGGWGYTQGMAATPAMTCAGLIGLAVAYGVANEAVLQRNDQNRLKEPEKSKGGLAVKPRQPKDPNRDPSVRAGLVALGNFITGPYANAQRSWGRGPPANFAVGRKQPDQPGKPQLPEGMEMPQGMGRGADTTDYYLLWSIERVAMAYGLKTIAKKDWYDWGADILLAKKRTNGSWQGAYEVEVDTSFALLFLRRSNLVSDLTSSLKGRVQDPSEVQLRSGGVGGETLRSRNAQASGTKDDRPQPEESTGSIPKLKIEGDQRARGKARPGASSRPAAPPGDDSEAGKLANQLVTSSADRQAALIEKLRDNKGGVHTQALAVAIPQLSGTSRQKAREALADRLTRMTVATLRDMLQDEDLEIRRAAALACALKEEKSFVPDLIKLLDDAEPHVWRAAHAALKTLTSQDFGPELDANRSERSQALSRWKEWWDKNK